MQLKHYLRLGIQGVALFLALVLLDTTCSAQTPIDVTIIVDGAWAYVPDPANTADRIIAIAPGTAPYHRNGIDVTPKPKPDGSPIPVGSYKLEIPNYKFSQCTSTSSDAALYHIDVSAAAVQNAITAKNMRYAFSLPKPCYYKYKDRSISKVSDTQITTPYDQVVGDLYAMEMELHYTVTAVSSSTLTGSSDAGKPYTDTINFNGKQIKFSLAADPGANDDADCDTTSAGSFLALMDLFGLQRYIWFPFLNGSLQAGNKGYFVDGCEKDNVRSQIQSNMKVAKAGLDNIKILEAYIRQAAPNRPEEISRLLAAVNTAAESLRTATSLPARPQKGSRPDFEIVQQEIQKARIYFTSKDLTVPRSEQKRTRQTESARPRFTLSKKYFMYSAAGSGDCHAGQTGVNTIP